MTGSLKEAWGYLDTDLWIPVSRFSRDGSVAPESVFVDLFKAVFDYLAIGFSRSELEEAGNDPAVAETYFRTLKGTDFSNELAIVRFLEDVDGLILGYEIPSYSEYYRRLVEVALVKFNLRYKVVEPFKLRFLLPASFGNLYAEIQRVNAGNPDLVGLLDEFEVAFDGYVRDPVGTSLKVCIAKASNYVEGLASASAGYPESGNTLGALIGRVGSWPHQKLQQVLRELWIFCCDYPGIRHAGHPAEVVRTLEGRDLVLATVAMFSFAGHLSASIDEVSVLGI